jgi:hypothetical protein
MLAETTRALHPRGDPDGDERTVVGGVRLPDRPMGKALREQLALELLELGGSRVEGDSMAMRSGGAKAPGLTGCVDALRKGRAGREIVAEDNVVPLGAGFQRTGLSSLLAPKGALVPSGPVLVVLRGERGRRCARDLVSDAKRSSWLGR